MREFTYELGRITPGDLTLFNDGKFVVEFDDSSRASAFILHAISRESYPSGLRHSDVIRMQEVKGRIIGGGIINIGQKDNRPIVKLYERSTDYGGIPYPIAKNLGDLVAKQIGQDTIVSIATDFIDPRFGTYDKTNISNFELLKKLGFTLEDHYRQLAEHTGS